MVPWAKIQFEPRTIALVLDKSPVLVVNGRRIKEQGRGDFSPGERIRATREPAKTPVRQHAKSGREIRRGVLAPPRSRGLRDVFVLHGRLPF